MGDNFMEPSVDMLFKYYDRTFVRLSYLLIFNREPDLIGENYYLDRLRSGISRVHILDQMIKSSEKKTDIKEIKGLSELIAKYQVEKVPVVGHLVGFLRFLFNYNRRINKLENIVGALGEEKEFDPNIAIFHRKTSMCLSQYGREIFSEIEKSF